MFSWWLSHHVCEELQLKLRLHRGGSRLHDRSFQIPPILVVFSSTNSDWTLRIFGIAVAWQLSTLDTAGWSEFLGFV